MAQAKQLLLRALLAAAAAGGASAVYQRVADARDRRRFPPPGRLVPVGGDRRLHLYEVGEGTPAVVIVPALSGSILEWLHIVGELQQDTRVCVYDRAGIGWSDPPPPGRLTIPAMAADLYALLEASGIAPPYVVAGHSLGGVVARRFAADHPKQVCGLVLVDSSHDDQAARLPWRQGAGANLEFALRRQARILGARRLGAALGLTPDLEASVAIAAPPEYAGAARAISLSTLSRRTTVAEMLLAARHRNQPPDLGSLPLTVLTSATTTLAVWPQLQDELAATSTASQHVHAHHAGHNIHIDEPEAVVRVLRDMIDLCRS
ncbi:MAG TPA: alpha/beta hydrolase [Streptosporangiaceae bacterium]|nr:alpha/beta hydrolase [Streptosporangiaceae bacterium]